MAKNFRDLTEAEILALAISLEEEDGRIYGDFADGLRESYPSTAAMFDEMQHEESEHEERPDGIDSRGDRHGERHVERQFPEPRADAESRRGLSVERTEEQTSSAETVD